MEHPKGKWENNDRKMDQEMLNLIAKNDQDMQDTLEERRDELCAFLLDPSYGHKAAQAIVAYMLSNHSALKALNNE